MSWYDKMQSILTVSLVNYFAGKLPDPVLAATYLRYNVINVYRVLPSTTVFNKY
jgi:hypothetical protein